MAKKIIQIQSILFNNDFEGVRKAVFAISAAANVLAEQGLFDVAIAYGDCSPDRPCLTSNEVAALEKIAKPCSFSYKFFNQNLGSARGHNRLAAGTNPDFYLIQNPDVLGDPRYIETLLACFKDASCGMAEARQLPIEHPKDYDPETGETCWATTACALIPHDIFQQLEGFDAETFFLYCDDVDFSWRVRLTGKKVIYQPAAIVFHDKRLSPQAGWKPSGAEQYYSVEAAFLMAHKWSQPQRVTDLLAFCDHVDDGVFRKAAEEYRRRLASGALPKPVEDAGRVAVFNGDLYASHRYNL